MDVVVNATEKDFEEILEIYRRARSFMKENGNPDQWGEGYPPAELLAEDIKKQLLYVLKRDGLIEGVFYFDNGPDETYNYIEGEWLNPLPYSVIHRIASAGRSRGVLKACVDWCLSRCDNLKIDTHDDNTVMQHSLEKLGFTYCGTIYLTNGEPRRAYQYDRHLDKA